LFELLQGYDSGTRSVVNATQHFVVEEVKVDGCGAVTIKLTDSVSLQLFPDGSQCEQWRIFRPGTDEEHFVVGG